MRRKILFLVYFLMLGLLLPSCGGSGSGGSQPSPTPPNPSPEVPKEHVWNKDLTVKIMFVSPLSNKPLCKNTATYEQLNKEIQKKYDNTFSLLILDRADAIKENGMFYSNMLDIANMVNGFAYYAPNRYRDNGTAYTGKLLISKQWVGETNTIEVAQDAYAYMIDFKMNGMTGKIKNIPVDFSTITFNDRNDVDAFDIARDKISSFRKPYILLGITKKNILAALKDKLAKVTDYDLKESNLTKGADYTLFLWASKRFRLQETEELFNLDGAKALAVKIETGINN